LVYTYKLTFQLTAKLLNMYLIHTLNNARIQCQILIDCYLFHQPYSGQEQDEKKNRLNEAATRD